MQLVVNIKEKRLKLDCPIAFPDGEYLLTIQKRSRKRSLGQLKYLWSTVYRIIADNTGHSETEVHDAMKFMFLSEIKEYKRPDGSVHGLLIARSLSDSGDIDTSEMTRYIEQVRAWASQERGIHIPNPGQESI